MAGALARLHLNADQLHTITKETMTHNHIALPLSRASYGIIARSLEILYSIEEALRIIDSYKPPAEPALPVTLCSGEGMAATEAPRGILYHRYRVKEDGTIEEAKIVPPTSQNQRRIEEDLYVYLPNVLNLPDREIARGCEQIIRHYDPCISCATHFLKLDITYLH